MQDYRILTQDQLEEVLTAGEVAKVNYPACVRGYVRTTLPDDRQGLIAVVHDQCVRTDEQMAQHHILAEQLATQTGQRVYMVFTAGRWHLLLFAIEVTTSAGVEGVNTRLWYDDMPGGVYANDQHIAHIDPDGTYAMDGSS